MQSKNEAHQEHQSTLAESNQDRSAGQGNSLDSCTPSGQPTASSHDTYQSIIRPAPRDEAFSPTGQTRGLLCYVRRRVDEEGYYKGEEYYPVIAALQHMVKVRLRSVTFHGCILHTGRHFIYPQKLDIPGRRPNSWNASLAEALSQRPGEWLRIWGDDFAQRYQFEIVPPPIDVTEDYMAFDADLVSALEPNVIERLDHPILLEAQNANRPDFVEESY